MNSKKSDNFVDFCHFEESGLLECWSIDFLNIL